MMFQAENPVISNNMMENKSTTFVSTTLKIVIFDRSVSTLSLDLLVDLVYAHSQKTILTLVLLVNSRNIVIFTREKVGL